MICEAPVAGMPASSNEGATGESTHKSFYDELYVTWLMTNKHTRYVSVTNGINNTIITTG